MQYSHVLPDYASIKDITQRFGISRATQYRLIGRGEIEAVKVGSATRLVTRSVERYFEGLPRLSLHQLP